MIKDRLKKQMRKIKKKYNRNLNEGVLKMFLTVAPERI